MQDVSEIFRGSGFKIFARILETTANAAVWAIPAPGGGSRAFCDRMNSWAQGEGQPGLGYIFFALDNGAVVGRGPVANNLGAEKTESAARAARPQGRRRGVLCRRRAGKLRQICRAGAHQASARSSGSSPRTASNCAGSSTSRCTNGTRRRRRSTSPTTRSRCRMRRSRNFWRSMPTTATRSWRSRPSNTTSSATASNCRPARSAIIAPT